MELKVLNSKMKDSKEILSKEIITEKELNKLKRRINNSSDRKTSRFILDLFDDREEGMFLTEEQNKKGYNWLMKQCKGKHNPFGYREQEALASFKYLKLVGWYCTNPSKHYEPVYRCVGVKSSFEYVVCGGQIRVIG